MIRTRIAPSPTGYLHVGNVRTALVNWLFTRKAGGEFILRIDDTDQVRSKQEYTDAIYEDMRWLGLTWDREEHQSKRFDRYDLAIEKLRASGRLYACYETPEELDIQRKQLASRGLPPIYNRAGLKLSEQQKAAFDAQGRKAHWRFLLNDEEIVWDDLIRGDTRFKATHMSDPVLIRADGVPVYTLASVVDDGEMEVSHVIRGEDHVSNTAVQIQLWKALGFKVPTFAHLALLKTKEGELSKRLGGNDIRGMREAGILPMAINSLLGRIGTSAAIEALDDLQKLVADFDFKKFGRAPANYDALELEKLNEKLLHNLSFDKALPLFNDHIKSCLNEGIWLSIRPNLKSVSDVQVWVTILQNEVFHHLLSDNEQEYVKATASLLPETIDDKSLDIWINKIKETTDRRGKDLFMPLRKALTARIDGPELKKVLPLIGREKILKRLNG